MTTLLLIPHIQAINANALSSPYTLGFPAMTAWFGMIHALQRQLKNHQPTLKFKRFAVVSHEFTRLTYKDKGDFVNSIIATSNPLDKEGKRPSFIEEARCHLTASLLIEYEGLSNTVDIEQLPKIIKQQLLRLKIAGGDIMDCKTISLATVTNDVEHRRLMRQLMPGFALIERRELMMDAMQNGQDALTALVDYLKVSQRSQLKKEDDETSTVEWTTTRKISNQWIVPIATGFLGITEPGTAQNQRNPETLHRFAESIVTLGEFIMPYRINDLNEILWHSQYDADNSLYLITQTPR